MITFALERPAGRPVIFFAFTGAFRILIRRTRDFRLSGTYDETPVKAACEFMLARLCSSSKLPPSALLVGELFIIFYFAICSCFFSQPSIMGGSAISPAS